MGIGRLDGSKFNLIMSVRHDASPQRLEQWRASFQRASEMIHDATDGQHQIGTIYVCNDSSGGRNADGWLLEEDGISSAGGAAVLGAETIHMTLYGDERFKPFILCHELMHYLYGPVDEYSGPSGPAECIGTGPPNDACILERGWWVGDRFGDDATGGPLVIGDFSELCVASNHDPDGDTYQESRYGESCWETLVTTFPGLSLPAGLPMGPEPASADTVNWVLLAPEERFVVVLDRSGSMAGTKLLEAKLGADWWAQQTLEGELLGVVSYGSTASTPADYPLQSIVVPTDRDDASLAISTLSAGGLTAMGDAMRAALDEFTGLGQRAATQVIVLLTDGLTNIGENPADVLPDLIANGVRVYTIGIGSTIDAPLLELIASETGGSLHRIDPTLSTSGQETAIRDALIEISGVSRDGGGVVTTLPEKIVDGTLESEVLIEEGSELATFAISWPQGDTMLFVDLEAPDGTIISAGRVPPNARELGSRRPWHGFQITKPTPGTWMMRVSRKAGNLGTPFRRFVFSRNRSIDGGINVPRQHQPGARVPVGFQLYHDAPLDKFDVKATVTAPHGQLTTVELEPVSEGDGCLAGYYEGWYESSHKAGVYSVTVDVFADGASQAAGGEKLAEGETSKEVAVPSFVRHFTNQFLVGEENHPRFKIKPNEGAPGDTLRVEFRGRGTGWYPRGTKVGFGDGIEVRGVEVLGPERMLAKIKIHGKAEAGIRTVTVSTPRRSGTLALDEGFHVKVGRKQRPIGWPVTRIRYDRSGRVSDLLAGDRVLDAPDVEASVVLEWLRSGATITALTDGDGAVTGFEVE